MPLGAEIDAKSSMIREPATLSSGEPLKLYPARIPAAGLPLPVGMMPGVIVPWATTKTVLLDRAAGASFIAAIPELPD